MLQQVFCFHTGPKQQSTGPVKPGYLSLYLDFAALDTTSSFGPVIITLSTRGRHRAGTMGCNKLPSQLTYMVIFLIRTGRNSLIYFLGPAVSSISACQCPSHCHRWWPYEHHKRSGQHQLTQMFALLAALNQSHLRLSCMSTKTIKIQNYRIPSDVGDNNQELLEPQNGIIQTSAWFPVLLLVIQASVSKANVVPCFKDVWWKLYSSLHPLT